MDTDDASKPGWWLLNEKLRVELDLPTYTPPRFDDGVFAHKVVAGLEASYGVTIRFLGINTEYLDDWDVYVDGEQVFEIGRHRNENGNTVYEMSAEEFRQEVERVCEQQG